MSNNGLDRARMQKGRNKASIQSPLICKEAGNKKTVASSRLQAKADPPVVV
jgi:hypothetical protein